MNVLLIHQNFPGQYRRLFEALAALPEYRVVGIGDAARLKDRQHSGALVVGYPSPKGASGSTHAYLKQYEAGIRRGQAVARCCLDLKRRGFAPDVVFAHPGWGEALFLRDVFPDARIIVYAEFYWGARGLDVGFDPEFPIDPEDVFRLRIKPSFLAQSLLAADRGVSPTNWQRQSHPPELRDKIEVLHEGIDTDQLVPDPQAVVKLPTGQVLTRRDKVLTYVARNLEPYRGFHVFMRALPDILRRVPDAQVLVVGDDGVSYGQPPAAPHATYREQLTAELGSSLPAERVHFLGPLPFSAYLRVLQVSRVHAYFTYPFVLSWSMLEAMSVGAQVLASATAPVCEVLTNGENGRLFDFFDRTEFCDAAVAMLSRRPDSRLQAAARATAVARFDFRRVGLPGYQRLLEPRGANRLPV